MTILVLAEHNNTSLHPATKHAVTAAAQIGTPSPNGSGAAGVGIHVLVAGSGCDEAAKQAAAIKGVTKVLQSDAPHYAWPLAENIAPLIASVGKSYSHILATATTTGKDIMPRAAALLDMAQVSEIVQIISPDTYQRPFYAGNALETVQAKDAAKIITVRQAAFAAASDGGDATIEKLAPLPDSGLSQFVEAKENKSERPELTSARIVVSGGRGFGSTENFKKIEALADRLGAAIGASRAAVDAGYVPNDYQVGQTGKVVAPDLYIAIGISGAIQHLAGMKDSKIIVAINKDENAPIFDVADYGLVADWETTLPRLEQLLSK
ncbi:MAG: FAD-binding protein [Pseudomonadota bacterium]|nr:FAD-binding protein [Pseudomonadota bacterium]MDE3037060.1 FAD-binding protein [Pseudomonadota bacterium]